MSTTYIDVQFCTVQISTPVQYCSVLYSVDQYPHTVFFSTVDCRSLAPYSAVQCGTVRVEIVIYNLVEELFKLLARGPHPQHLGTYLLIIKFLAELGSFQKVTIGGC